MRNEDKQKRLDTALEANEPLFIMHTMKEQLRLLWKQPSWTKAHRFLVRWILDALDAARDYQARTGSSVLRPLRSLAFTLTKHMTGMLNYFKYRITNGKIEGINNKIKTLKRQACGFRDQECFRLRLLHLHSQKVQLVG